DQVAPIRRVPAPLVIARLEYVPEDGTQTWHTNPDVRRGHQPEDHAGDRRVDARGIEAQPHHAPEEEVYRHAPDAEPRRHGDQANDKERQTDCDEIQGAPVSDRHDQYRTDIVEDRQGYEKKAHAVRNAGTKEREP